MGTIDQLIQEYQEDRMTRQKLAARANALRKKIQSLQAERWSDEASQVEVEIDLKKARRALAKVNDEIEKIDMTYLTVLY